MTDRSWRRRTTVAALISSFVVAAITFKFCFIVSFIASFIALVISPLGLGSFVRCDGLRMTQKSAASDAVFRRTRHRRISYSQ